MNKYFLLLLFFILSAQLHSQIIKKDNQCVGYGKFILGESITNYPVTFLTGGNYSKDNHEFKIYGYSPAANEPVEIVDIRFNSNLMTFNDSDKLVSFSFIKFYKKVDSPKYAKESKKDYEKIVAYITGELGKKGESKVYFKNPNTVDKGYEWNDGITILKIKRTASSYHAAVEFHFSYPGH